MLKYYIFQVSFFLINLRVKPQGLQSQTHHIKERIDIEMESGSSTGKCADLRFLRPSKKT